LEEDLLGKIDNIDGIWVAVSDTAHVNTAKHLEVAVVTPGSTPRVLNYPVVLPVFGAIPDSKDSMIDVHRSILAVLIRIDACLVVSEACNNLEGDRNRTDHEKVVAKILLTEGDIVGASNYADTLLKSWQLALLIDCSVRIEILSDETTSVHDIFKGVRRQATFASKIVKTTSAINKLLLTEVSELSVLLHKVSLHASHCGEGPAASTLGLVLDGSNYSIVTPVPVGRDILDWDLKRNCLLGILMGGRALLCITYDVEIVWEFSIGHVWVLVETLLPSKLGIGVMSNYLLHLCGE